MNLLNRKQLGNTGVVKAPVHDPYGRYKNDGTGVFGFRKDNHVIVPGVTYFEEQRLKSVKKYVEDKTSKECTLPQELINDVYSLYVNEDVTRRPETNENSVRHQVLDAVYNSLTKVVTTDSPLYTQMLTRELALTLQIIEEELKDEQEKEDKKNGGDGSGDGTGGFGASNPGKPEENSGEEGKGKGEGEGDGESEEDSSSPGGQKAGSGSGTSRHEKYEKMVQDVLKKHESKIDEAIDSAGDKIKDLEEKLGKEAMKDLMNNDAGFLDEIEGLKDALSKVSFKKESIKKVLNKILNESQNYFSAKYKTIEESLFDCEECEDLFGLEYLHPAFKNAEIMSAGNATRIYKGKIDLYLDCSGSMTSNAQFEGDRLRMIDLVKGIAMMLFRMNMIENLYFFDGALYKIDNVNELTILGFNKSGGTNFNNVVHNINQNGNNSVIITDGHDSCSTYSKKAFWIGVGGTKFSTKGDSFDTYRATKQCVAYNPASSNFDYCI
jgi:hypothetical protein